MAKLREQPDRRRYQVFTDQHGRKYGAVIEVDSGGTTGPVNAQFKAPYLPSASYFRFSKAEAGSFTIDYDAAIRDLTDAHEAWRQSLVRYAEGNYGQTAGEAIKDPTPDMLSFAGPKPTPVEFPMAAKAGNKWMLGFVDAVPDWARPLLPKPITTVTEFPDVEFDDASDDLYNGEPDTDTPKPAKRRKAAA